MTTKTPMTIEQCVRLLEAYDSALIKRGALLEQLFASLTEPVNTDPAGRDLFTIMSELRPDLVAHLQDKFVRLVDRSNQLNHEFETERLAILSDGIEPPSSSIN